MMQSSYLQNNKRNKKRFDDAGYEDSPMKNDKKKKKDFSQDRQRKRGEV